MHIHTHAKQTMLSQSIKSMHTFVSSGVLYRSSMRRCGQADLIAEWCTIPPVKPLGPSSATNPNSACSWPPCWPTMLLGTFLSDLQGLYLPNVAEKNPWTRPKSFWNPKHPGANCTSWKFDHTVLSQGFKSIRNHMLRGDPQGTRYLVNCTSPSPDKTHSHINRKCYKYSRQIHSDIYLCATKHSKAFILSCFLQ